MQLIRTLRIMPALVVALVALFVVASGSAMASTAGQHHGPVASAAHHKKKKKPKKPKAPKAPKGPFVAKDAGSTPIGTGPDDTLVETLSVPAGSTYVVTAKAELGNNAASDNSITCKLLEGFNPIDTGTEALAPLATFSRTITLTSTSSGGSIKLVCSGDKAGQARNRVITAVRSS
jgi:glucose/arabinose dehydrogenase